MPWGFYAMLSRMKYIQRWGLMRNTRPENLSEHSLETAILAHALASIGNGRLGKHHNTERVALCAMYHDVPEILTGDMPTPVKYFNPHIQEAYKDVEKSAAHRLLDLLPGDLKGDFQGILFMEGLTREEKKLIKAADKLGALLKCIEEESAGNLEFRDAKLSTLESLNEMQVEEAAVFMEEFLPAYHSSLDSLSKMNGNQAIQPDEPQPS